MVTRTKAHVVLLLAAQLTMAGCSRSHDGPDAAEPCCDAGPPDAGADAGREPDTGPPDAPPPCVPAEESCNGADDDCDGAVDETPSELACLVPNASAACAVGACAIAECHFGFADCDGDAANGCETHIETDATACGACEWACAEGVACHDGVYDDERVIDVSAGQEHACALRQSGEALCWGNNDAGQLGTGDRTSTLMPATPVVGSGAFVDVIAMLDFSCALERGGTVACWGGNGLGQLGDGTRIDRPTATPSLVSDISRISSGAFGNPFVLALDNAGRLWGWGNNYYGQLGPTGYSEAALPTPFDTGIAGLRDVDAGHGCACGVFEDASLDCWGGLPPPTDAGSRSWARAYAGQWAHGCAIDAAGDLYCWGSNGSGQVGPFPCSDCANAQRVDLGERVVEAAPGHLRTCALTESGRVFCWGIGRDVVSGGPTHVTGVEQAVRVSYRYEWTCALDARARVWCWNGFRVGDGTTELRRTPVLVAGLYRRGGG